MIAWSVESFVNVLAGCSLLVFAVRAYQRIEPVTMAFFAAAWGLHIILKQSEYGAVAQVLMPLEAMFLFLFTDYVALYHLQHEIAHGLAWVTGACAVVVAGLLLLGVPLVEPWSTLFLQGPYHLGLSLCILLLAWYLPSTQDSHTHWQILTGLTLPLSYSTAALFYPGALDPPRLLPILILITTFTALVVVLPLRLNHNAALGEDGVRRRHQALVFLILAAWLGATLTHPLPASVVQATYGLVVLASTWSLLWPPVRFRRSRSLDMENWIPDL